MNKIYTKEMEEKVFKDSHKNAYDFIKEEVKDYGDYTAMTYFGNNISYNEFHKNVNRYANKLKSFGLEKGDSIALLMPNTPEIVYYYYAAWALGIVVCPLDPRTNPKGIAESVNNSKSKILCSLIDSYKEKVSPILDKINVEKVVIVSPTDAMGPSVKGVVGKALYKLSETKLNLVDKDFSSSRIVMNKNFLKGASEKEVKTVYEEMKYGMPAAHIFTSGTEGDPKAAVHSHEAYIMKSKQVDFALPNGAAGDTFLGIIPFFSAYGSFAGMNDSLARGMNIIMIPQFDPGKIPELICEYRPNTVIAVPNYWHDFADRAEELMPLYGLKDLSFIKYPVSGGDKQPAIDVFRCNELFKKYGSNANLLRGYGSTEVGGAIATTIDDESLEDGEYSGILFPGTKYKFLDLETGEISEEAKEGELLVSDPSLMIEYLDNEEATARNIYEIDGDRYFRMGDIFKIDDEDRLYFGGRVKRAMMRPDGHTVHALPIETCLEESGLIDQCCVVGLGVKGKTGTVPTAFIKVKENVPKDNDTIAVLDNKALHDLSERNRALAYVFVDEIPKTLMDKIDYKKLEKLSFDDVDAHIVDDTFFSKKVIVKMK